jgi:hypothetical protein
MSGGVILEALQQTTSDFGSITTDRKQQTTHMSGGGTCPEPQPVPEMQHLHIIKQAQKRRCN